jgi:hypothetical protein
MSSLRRTIAGLACAMTVAVGTPALCADAPPSAHSLELARHLFAGMHMDQMMTGMMKNMAPAMIDQARKANPSMTQAQAEAITDAVSQSTQAMMGKMVDRMIPLYASTFTEKELQDAVAFYDGPSGQAMLAKMPVLMSKMTPMMVELMPEMQADMRKRLCAKIDCKTLTPAAPRS